jgi:outer membrane protein, multidrug efflux system
MFELMNRTHRKRLGRFATVAVAVAVLVAGCAVGPDYRRPDVPLASGFINSGATAVNSQAPAADIAVFWRAFGDAQLDALIDRAIAANGDVRIAQARLQEARANFSEAGAGGLPVAGIDAGATRGVSPITQQPGSSRSDRTGTVYEAGFIANWELDFFGRYRRGSEAAAAFVDAGQAGLAAAHTAVAAEVARNYLTLRGLQQRQEVTEAALINQRDALRITEARFDAGRGTQLDLVRARTLVASTEANLPQLQNAVERTLLRLATLTAQPPRSVIALLGTAAPLPGLPATDLGALPIGTPEQWLQRRPDIIAAERQLAASTASIGLAKAELFPRISLRGLLGLNAATFGNLGKSESGLYSVGIGLSWLPLDFGAIRARIAASEARAKGSLASYEQTVATALEETEGAFSSYTRSAQRGDRLQVAAASAQEAAQLARLRFDAGVTDFLIVLDAEREVLSTRDLLVQARIDTATSLVSVYRALGGGWDTAMLATPMKARSESTTPR